MGKKSSLAQFFRLTHEEDTINLIDFYVVNLENIDMSTVFRNRKI